MIAESEEVEVEEEDEKIQGHKFLGTQKWLGFFKLRFFRTISF